MCVCVCSCDHAVDRSWAFAFSRHSHFSHIEYHTFIRYQTKRTCPDACRRWKRDRSALRAPWRADAGPRWCCPWRGCRCRCRYYSQASLETHRQSSLLVVREEWLAPARSREGQRGDRSEVLRRLALQGRRDGRHVGGILTNVVHEVKVRAVPRTARAAELGTRLAEP